MNHDLVGGLVDIKQWVKVDESYNPAIASETTDLSNITKQLKELYAKLERTQLRALTPEPRKNVQFQEPVLNKIPSYRPRREQSPEPNLAVVDRQPRSDSRTLYPAQQQNTRPNNTRSNSAGNNRQQQFSPPQQQI